MANQIQHCGNPGATPAVIASILVPEVIKYFMGVGDLLADRLLIYDGMSIGFREFKVKK
jgi:adenylyltransferase/sulfurtransferase